MLKATEGLTPKDVIDMIIRRRWFIIIPFCLSMMVGIYLAVTLPKIYRAETYILVQPQKVPDNYVQSIVSADIDSRISTISQQILSRTNIEKIIEKFNLFSGPQHEGMYLEDKIGSLRKRISVEVTRAKRSANAFSISFEGTDPIKVMEITNTLATYFIDENLKVREAQAVGTSDFIDNERMEMRKRLEEADKNLRLYRERYMGELPEQLETNLRILDRIQIEISEKQQMLMDARSRLSVFEAQISEGQFVPAPNRIIQPGADGLKNLSQLKNELIDLRSKYTDQHPDIIRLKKQIADMEGKGVDLTDETSAPLDSGSTSNKTVLDVSTSRQHMELKREVFTLEKEISDLRYKINLYQTRVENTPKREQELMSLKRDYQNIQEAYSSLLNRKLEAEIAVNMEKKQKGEQFRILDPARIPERPVSPDMKRLFLIVVAIGLGLGGGLAFVLEHFDTSFRRTEDIESLIGIPVLATLPVIYDQKAKRKQKAYQFLSLFLIMISFVLFTGFAVLTFNGVDQTIELVSRFITT